MTEPVRPRRQITNVIAIALAIIAGSATAAHGAATTRSDSHVTLAKANAFHGRLHARSQRCEAGRKVRVLLVKRRRDEVVGRTTTNRRGRWSEHVTPTGGRYYAKVGRERLASKTTVVCRRDRSGDRHFRRPPNVLIFLTDDQREAGSMVEMPVVRRVFGRGGTEFTNGYVTTPQCCPSRSSIFSGQYAHNTGVITNDGTGFDADQSWQRYLHDHGYFTGLVGKYFNNVRADQAPHFDYMSVGRNAREAEQTTISRAVGRFFKRAEDRDSKPWALVVSTYSPHTPWTTMPNDPRPVPPFEPPYKPRSFQEADRTDKHPSVQGRSYSDDLFREKYRGQQLETQSADEEFADLWRTIRDKHEHRRLLAFFLSDNGYAWGDHGLWGKGEPYLEHSAVPFFVRWPDHFAAGARDERIAANIDIAPTIYDAAQISPHYAVDGRSLLGDRRRSWLLLEFENPDVARIPPWRSYVVPGQRQYIEWSDGFVENYNLRRDPAELRARNDVDPSIAAKIDAAKRCSGTACP
jgi:hypothetical protein